ncbi:Helix-loop-helix protein delilah [Frankliniella fusca]|uniref:Helix-loop-helix protein delilah n=1 Tax=Frankliniella fusca TaxID=407009 RepID=A0AAE1I1E6_9NEOP|nr:Helix-loop-helix protein delilah [Frankliniella fusca]
MRMEARAEPADANNNQAGLGPVPVGAGPGAGAVDKYSLRPRSLKKRAETELRRQQAAAAAAAAAQQQQQPHLAVALQGGMRYVQQAQQHLHALPSPGAHAAHAQAAPATTARPSRPKQKPAPLSKYRRKTANARERSRMREINVAFETLRRAVPHTAAPACASEKLTKITTLRLAMKYIAALTQAVREAQQEDALADDPAAAYTPPLSFGAPDSPCSLGLGLGLPTFDQFRGCGSASSSSSLSTGQGGLGDPDFADHNSLLSADFADFPEPSLGMGSIADLVDPCLTAVALTSDDFYDATFMTDFS